MKTKQLITLFSLLLIIVTSCVTPMPPDRPTPNPTEPDCKTLLERQEVVADRYWVKCQVIISGVASDIDEVLKNAKLEQQGLTVDQILTPIDDQTELGQLLQKAEQLEQFREELKQYFGNLKLPVPLDKLEELTTRRYGFKEDIPVEDVVRAVNAQLYGDQTKFVFADPNYLIQPTGYSNCVAVSITGPRVIGNGPYGDPAPVNAPEHLDFTTQWALRSLTNDEPLTNVVGKEPGAGVQVVIFDTSPFAKAVASGNMTITIDWSQPQFTVEVEHPILTSITPSTSMTLSTAPQHGLFVAGLVQAIAPNSTLRLIRVLDDNGCGTMEDLGQAIINFLTSPQSTQPTIFNLSLSIYCPEDCAKILIPITCNVGDKECLDQATEAWYLAFPTWWAKLANVVIVAATGNDSADEFAAIIPPNQPGKPASYPFVLGVAASTSQQIRACYSNVAFINDDIAAPGGDGGPADIEEITSSGANTVTHYACAPVAHNCSGVGAACEYGLMSVVQQSVDFPTGYAYWSGTSFATPLVSGAAAICLAQVGLANQVNQALLMSTQSPAIPPGAIDHGSLGSGILNLQELMKNCQRP